MIVTTIHKFLIFMGLVAVIGALVWSAFWAFNKGGGIEAPLLQMVMFLPPLYPTIRLWLRSTAHMGYLLSVIGVSLLLLVATFSNQHGWYYLFAVLCPFLWLSGIYSHRLLRS